ncbi:hypothetical protein [Aquicella lusitana]|uniref:Uncharacterized protein n=1 Tax=Aquicella lusitana TaxID=254246 RepID=A0A370GE57_9COXI|nr:hypothetical protein [Aquicella lusitana]RDI42098.1 hypothetical protein C8D86_11652 [Aquicella lusitana]VVC74395.1 hypothetical protein AQULUS_21610 [Aquicella lusitana]
MQRSNINALPPKAKLQDEINNKENNCSSAKKKKDNEFSEVKYHKKSWLFGFFGEKDGTTDVRYFGLKSEISSFASECYRMYTNCHSPKYRPVYDRKRTLVFGTYSPHYQLRADYESVGFITEKINKPITLSKVFDFLDYLKEDGHLLWSPYISSYYQGPNVEKYFEESRDRITYWYENSIKNIDEKFNESNGVMEESEFLNLKNIFIDFLSHLKETLLLKLENEQLQCKQEDNFNAERISNEIELLYKRSAHEFYQMIIGPIKQDLILKFEKYLLENGLPEIMAIGYALGEWSFKARDIIFDTNDYNVFKIDHERCLWEISHALLIDLNVTDLFGKAKKIISQQSISSQDIDEFPKRTNPPRFWPSSEDDHKYPQWFLDLLNKEQFKKRAYITLLAFSITPDKTMHSLGSLFFNPIYFEKIIEHVNKRKNNLGKALRHSKEFAEFLITISDTEIKSLFISHNSRWNKPKYDDICIDFEKIKIHLDELKDYLQRKKDKIDPLVNHIYTIKAPKML